MAAQGFAPLSNQTLNALSYNQLQGFAAFEDIVQDLIMWVEGNYSGFAAEPSFATAMYPDKGETLADKGNMAWTWAQINGVTKDFMAFSTNSKMPTNKRAKKTTEDFSESVPKNQYQQPDFSWLTGQVMKDNHTEPKVLMEAQSHFNLDMHASNGYLIIVSSRDVCNSCQRIISAFATAFPHIIVYGVGLGQIGQYQKDVKDNKRKITTRMRSGSVSDDLPAIQANSTSLKPLQLLCFQGASVAGKVFTP